jgi:alpha-L-fucosidase
MFRKTTTALICATAVLLLSTCRSERPEFEPTWESLEGFTCPEWFRDAKLGMFLHWGPASVPAVDGWYGRNMYIQGHRAYEYHVKTFGHPSKFGYKDIIPLWKAENFDPDHLVGVFKKAGARYVVPVAVHHDNFDLWNSTHHRWNAVNMGPKKDIIDLWRKAVLKHGLRFGVSTHHDRSWSWFNTSKQSDKTGPLAGVPYDGNNPAYEDFYCELNDVSGPYVPPDPPQAWKEEWLIRTRDLVDNYDPDLIYFDGGAPWDEIGRMAMAHFYNHNRKIHNGRLEGVINLKDVKSGAYREGTCVLDLERGKLKGIKPEPWQTCTSTNGPWFYERNGRYESTDSIIDMFVDIISKNGNLLLNIPLKADGTLDEPSARFLEDLAQWMEINGEAVHGSRPWVVFGEGPTETRGGYSEVIREAFTSRDIRFTRQPNTLYAFFLDWPEEGEPLIIQSLSNNHPPKVIAHVSLLGYDGELDWERSDQGLRVQLPPRPPSAFAYTLKITSTHGHIRSIKGVEE